MKKHDARTLSKDAQAAIRTRVVAAIDAGMRPSVAALTFGVSRQSIATWRGRATREGMDALVGDNRGRPKGTRLERADSRAAKKLARKIVDKTPDQYKLPFALWTREAVVALIKRESGVNVSVRTAGRYLRAWGFTPQKPRRRAFEQDPEAVQKWLTTEYPRIVRQAKRDGAEIHWGDEMGLRSDHQTGTSWSLKGQTPVIAGTGQRFRCNMISTVTNRGTLRFMVFKGSFTNDVFIRFLERLLKSAQSKIYLILDRHPVHKSRKVQQWFEDHEAYIRLFLLPSYSPELNPDECLNNDVKANALGRRRPHNADEMIADLSSYLHSTQKRPDIVRNFFKAKTVAYAA
jgi:transposase